MDPYKVLKYSLITEKSMDKVDKENKAVFIVDRKANKNQIKEAVEKLYKVKVTEVNTTVTLKGDKKAFVQLHPESSAEDIISKAGVM
jgi:ribosomal protein uL23